MSATDITTGKELDVNKIKSAIEEIRTLALTEQKQWKVWAKVILFKTQKT